MIPPQRPFVDSRTALSALKQDSDWARPAPPRADCSVEPLIEAAAMFPQLEELALGATTSVWMSFRIFDLKTKTRSEAAKRLGLEDWAAVIRHIVGRGVEVRILLADFEPVLADYLHAGSWTTFQHVREIVDTLPEQDRVRLQLIVVQHEGELGWAWRQLLRFPLRRRIRGVVDTLLGRREHKDGGLDTRPGLWRHLAWDGSRPVSWRPAPPPRLWPATYHQKFVVVDGRVAIIGGLDLDERRWDDRRHRQRANQTWHDISARIEGPVVGDAARHFAFLWNRELPRYRAIVAEWTDGCGQQLMLDPLNDAARPSANPSSAGDAVVQLVRTLSVRSPSAFAIGPQRGIRELKAAHRNVILSARRLLYIEAQFFRSREAAEWVEQALASSPDLEVIILVANVPEEIAFEGQGDNIAHRHGEYLQARALGRLLRKAGPRRIGLFTLAKQESVAPNEEKFEETRGTAYGSGVIHIHSKLLVADDEVCLLSSANINGRSFDWDTELGFIWAKDPSIAAFRRTLWDQLFGGLPSESLTLEDWRDVARHNSGVAPEERKGFILPYQLGRARRFAKPYFFVPDDLV